MDGVSVTIPGAGSQTLLKSPSTQFPSTAKAATVNEWYFTCTTATDGNEGFIGHAPNGDKYHFKKYISRPYKELGFANSSDKLTRIKIQLAATKVEDVHGNTVDYTYIGSQLKRIESSDGRVITLGYSGDLISTVTANTRTWNYSYRDSIYVKHDWDVNNGGDPFGSKVLDKVTRPDNLFWEFDLDGMQSEASPSAKAICGSGGPPLKVKHPHGAVGDFKVRDIKHRQANNYYATVIFNCEASLGKEPFDLGDGGYNPPTYVEIRHTRALAVTEKKITQPGAEENIWAFEYERDDVCGIMGVPCGPQNGYIQVIHSPANLYYNDQKTQGGTDPFKSDVMYTSSGADPIDYTNWTKVTQPDGSIITHYHHWNYEEVVSGQKIRQEVHNDSVLMDETNTVFVQQGCNGSGAIGLGVGSKSGKCPTHMSKVTQQRDGDIFTTEMDYNTSRSASNYSFGNPIETRSWSKYPSENESVKRITARTYDHNISKWILGLTEGVVQNNRKIARYDYDLDGQVTKAYKYADEVTGNDYEIAEYDYNSDGTLAWIEDALDRRTTFSDWKRGKPETVLRPDNTTISRVIDDDGWLESQTDAKGIKTSYEYNGIGWLTKILPHHNISPKITRLPTVITYTQTANYLVQHSTNGYNRQTTRYDSFLRPFEEIKIDRIRNNQSHVTTKYDGLGRVKFKSFATSLQNFDDGTNFTYDALGRMLTSEETVGNNASTSYAYLAKNCKAVTDALGKTTTTCRNGYSGAGGGEVISISQPTDVTTLINRNIFDEIESVTQSGAHNSFTVSQTQNFVYDDRRRLCRHYTPETGSILYEYNNANEMTSHARVAGNGTDCAPTSGEATLVSLTYDGLGRPKNTLFADPNTPDIFRLYDDNGNITQLTRGVSTEDNWIRRFYNYDDYNDMTGETLRVREIAGDSNSERVFDIDYFYNAYGHVRVKRLPSGRLMPYLNDGLGRPMRVGFADNALAEDIFYHPTGDVSAMDYGNGQALTQSLNLRRQIETIMATNGTDAAVDLTYGYDLNGRILSQTDGVDSDNSRDYAYDDLGRLLTASSEAFGTNGAFTYDSLGNIREKTMRNRTITMEYGTNNRLTRANDALSGASGGTGDRTLEYDDRGNVTKLGNLRFIYDMANQPRTVYGQNAKNEDIGNQYDNYYVYDGNMKRVKSVVNGRTIFNVYDAAGMLVHVEESAGPTSPYAETDYVHANGQTIARIKNGTFTYLHPDHLGSAQAGTKGEGYPINDIGKVEWRENYTPFGETLINSAANDNQAGFTGHIKDADTGLNYMQARYYDPVIGRFLSNDPVAFTPKLPASFGRYTYALNDPVNGNDPDGEFVNFVVKFAVDVALEVAIQVASGEDINLGAAAKGAAIGIIDPTKTARKVAKLGKLANNARKSRSASKAQKAGCNGCFIAGTLVDTEDGLIAIEDIQLGDLVWAKDEDTGQIALKTVTDLIRPKAREIYTVEIGNNEKESMSLIGTTDDHPWWVIGKGWTKTDQLTSEMKVITRDGKTLDVRTIMRTNRVEPAYNLTVADFETYFVSENKVLVHNCKENLTTGNGNPDLGGGTDFTKIDSPSANLDKAPPKLNTETRAPDSDWGGEAAKARLDAASNFDAEFTPGAVLAVGVDKAVKTVKKCLDKICGK